MLRPDHLVKISFRQRNDGKWQKNPNPLGEFVHIESLKEILEEKPTLKFISNMIINYKTHWYISGFPTISNIPTIVKILKQYCIANGMTKKEFLRLIKLSNLN